MIDKVTAEHRLTVMIDQHKMEMEKAMGKVNMVKLMFQKGHSKGNKGYSKPEASEGSRKSVVFSGLGKDDPSDRTQGAGSDQLLDRRGEDGVAQPGSSTRQCYQQPRGRCGVGAGVADDDPAPSKSLPLRIGQSAVNLIQHVQEGLGGALATLVYGNEPCVWEMFCSPDSALRVQGLNFFNPIDLFNNYWTFFNPDWKSKIIEKKSISVSIWIEKYFQ